MTAFTIVSDKEIKLLLDSNQEVVVRQYPQIAPVTIRITGGVSAKRGRTSEN